MNFILDLCQCANIKEQSVPEEKPFETRYFFNTGRNTDLLVVIGGVDVDQVIDSGSDVNLIVGQNWE